MLDSAGAFPCHMAASRGHGRSEQTPRGDKGISRDILREGVEMAATRRLQRELQDMRKADPKHFKNIIVDESNILNWKGLIVPELPPYNKGAFKIEIVFPAEYPFRPPKITFETKIYHPNVDEKGQVCLPIISPENWKPATKTDQIVESLVALVHAPEPEHPLRGELAEEYTKHHAQFMENATKFTASHAEKRP